MFYTLDLRQRPMEIFRKCAPQMLPLLCTLPGRASCGRIFAAVEFCSFSSGEGGFNAFSAVCTFVISAVSVYLSSYLFIVCT